MGGSDVPEGADPPMSALRGAGVGPQANASQRKKRHVTAPRLQEHHGPRRRGARRCGPGPHRTASARRRPRHRRPDRRGPARPARRHRRAHRGPGRPRPR
ncbi:MAG TPA: hypothetical protein DCS55_22240 [Acidimicrobiaceae bacterium]|nr:hypothetical protein [Acidimicrobiaceae bacterium]